MATPNAKPISTPEWASTAATVPAWQASTAYLAEDLATNGANVYEVVTAGTSAGSGGPTGTGTAIVDGTVTWRYLGKAGTAGGITEPSTGRKQTGWLAGERPPHGYFNWWQELTYRWTKFLDTFNQYLQIWQNAAVFEGPQAWAPSTAYVVGEYVLNSGKVYVCTVAGTGAGSGGPTGTGTGITDGTVTWDFAQLPFDVEVPARTRAGLEATQSTTNGVGMTATGNGTGAGVVGTGGSSNGAGVVAQGTGTGAGVAGTGGSTGHGGTFTAGATSGRGITATASGNDAGGVLTGSGSGAGVSAIGGTTGAGGVFTGGATGGAGLTATGTGGGNGATVTGQGTGAGLAATGGASGAGVTAIGGASGGVGLSASGTNGSSGTVSTGNGAGYGLVATGGASAPGVLAAHGTASTGAARTAALSLGNGDLSMVGVTPPNSTTAVTNALTPANINKANAMVVITGGSFSVASGFNIESVTKTTFNGNDVLRIAFAGDFASANYVCVPGAQTSTTVFQYATVVNKAASHVDVALLSLNGSPPTYIDVDDGATNAVIDVVCYGAQ